MTRKEWEAEAIRRFGNDVMEWKFKCPACGHVARTQDWKDAGANIGEVAFSCIGRHIPGSKEFIGDKPREEKSGPCNYTGGGLFNLNPLEVDGEYFFDFADVEGPPKCQS
jgi:hypothetical protein